MRLMTIQETADVLRVRPSRAYALVREGVLPAVRLRRTIRVEEEALHQWVRAGGQRLTATEADELSRCA
jgi:excisionase family DNA binding protein